MEPELRRHSQPNKYDHAPMGTQCKVFIDYDTEHIYIQISPNSEDPRWEYIETKKTVR